MEQFKRRTILLVGARASSLSGRGAERDPDREAPPWEFLASPNVEQSLRIAESERELDLVLMDGDLGGGLDCREASGRILARRDLPIVFLVGRDDTALARELRDLAGYGCVSVDADDFVLRSSLGMAIDLFEARERLLSDDVRLSTFSENISDILWIVNLGTGRLVYISAAVERLRGYSVDEAMAQSLEQTLAPASRAKFQSRLSRLRERFSEGVEAGLANGIEEISELEFLRKDGTSVWTENAGRVARDGRGEPILIGTTRDISGRRRSEEELRESEEKLRRIVSNSSELIGEIDAEGRYTFVSERFEKDLGYKAEELLGTNAAELLHPDDLGGALSSFDSLKAGCGISVDEWRIRDKGGNYRPFECRGSAYRTKGGELRSVIVARDITERARSEETLRESEARFKNLLRDVQCIAVQGYSPDGIAQYWNRASEALYGYREEEVLGRSLLDLIIPPEMRVEVEAAIRRMAETGEPIPSSELSLMRKDGSRVPVFSSHTIVRLPGKAQELFCIDIDLREKKEAEEALRESEEIFRRFMENSPVYVFFKDERGRSLRLSANFEAMLGKPVSELIGKTMDELFPSDLAKSMIADDRRILREGKQVVVDEELGGRHYTTIKFPITLGGESRYLAGYTIDITERKQAEERIKSLLEEKEILLKEVHHRVKNNMNTMNSLLSLQAGNAKDPTAAAALNDAALRLQSMMVLYEKLYESDSRDALSAMSYFPTLVDDIAANFPESSKVRIEKRIEDFPLGVKKLQLLGIIVNELLTNAMKYAFAGRDRGLILISVSLDRDRVTLVLQDDGVGLPEAAAGRASTGFGLRLVALLAQQLGGTMSVEREEGTRVVLAFDR